MIVLARDDHRGPLFLRSLFHRPAPNLWYTKFCYAEIVKISFLKVKLPSQKKFSVQDVAKINNERIFCQELEGTRELRLGEYNKSWKNCKTMQKHCAAVQEQEVAMGLKKKKTGNRITLTLGIRLSAEEKQELLTFAERERRSLSNAISVLLQEALLARRQQEKPGTGT